MYPNSLLTFLRQLTRSQQLSYIAEDIKKLKTQTHSFSFTDIIKLQLNLRHVLFKLRSSDEE